MTYEVELKFPVTEAPSLWQKLLHAGADWSEPETQVDRYFGHPSRSFAETDEALRIRHERDATTLTYKGPVIDRATKTRQEIEVPIQIGADAAEKLAAVFCQLSFQPVREVRKTRRTAVLKWQGSPITCGWDEVPPLGTFLELEVLAETAELAAAQQQILSFAQHLGLPAAERRSYLELLLHNDAITADSAGDDHSESPR